MSDCYVGLMSGTSMDGIDAALVSFSDHAVQIHATHAEAYPEHLKDALLTEIQKPLHDDLDTDGELDRQVGECFRDAAMALIKKSNIDRRYIKAIGSHGQTLRHQPNTERPFSMQVGRADIIAAGTGAATVANFRQADIDAGGQGAPLVPPFHAWLFSSDENDRVVVNIGGIANITVLPSRDSAVIGFDTGPGNGLMDIWTRQHRDQSFDSGGQWAASGEVIESLLAQFLTDPYFTLAPPKSTGFEYFNLDWLMRADIGGADTTDVQATLCELAATTIANAIADQCSGAPDVFVCGGGVYNKELMRRLRRNLGGVSVAETSVAGLHPDWVEAVAFAWLAMRTVTGQTGNLPSVTGASHKVVLGDIHFP